MECGVKDARSGISIFIGGIIVVTCDSLEDPEYGLH